MHFTKEIFAILFATLFVLHATCQNNTISGKVTSVSGNPLPGTSVNIKNSSKGTVTNESGDFSISVMKGQVLVFSYQGFKTTEVKIVNFNAVNVTLEQVINFMDSVVVVGYGTQKREDITGAISSVSENALRDVPVTAVDQILQGQIPGVSVITNNNKPDGGVSVLIRGRRSFNAGNSPLFVIDGIPLQSGRLNDINPSDIGSVQVLKDASATAIYGSRGANGVILITTKRGIRGRTSVNYNTYFGINKITRYADLMNGAQFAEYKRESRRAVINPSTNKPLYDDNDPEADEKLFEPVELESIKNGTYTDWQRLMIKQGFTQNHELSVNGGSQNTLFNFSMGYLKNDGIISVQDFTRYSFRSNIDHTISKVFKMGVSSMISSAEINGRGVNPYGESVDLGALSENPLGKAYDEDGNLIFKPTSDGLRSNPLSELVPGAVINKQKRVHILANIYGEANIINGLKLRSSISPSVINEKTDDFQGSLSHKRMGGTPAASNGTISIVDYTWDNLLSYKKNFASIHSVDFTGLYSLQTYTSEFTGVSVSGLPLESLEYYNFGAASIINSVSSSFSKKSLLSYMARLNYAYDNRYLLTVTARADGSSKFYKGKRWGYFPSLAAGWNISNERFMQTNRLFSNLKLRVSYGKTGNEGIASYQTKGLLTRVAYDFGGTSAFGYRPSSIPNRDLKWETTAMFNTGLDFTLLKSRISGSVEYYKSKTTDLLLPMLLPTSSGFNSVLTNIGSKGNSGIEVEVTTQNIVSAKRNGFEWSTSLNLFTNKEKILELSRGKEDDIGDRLFIGYPAVVYYDYVKLGIWQLGEDDLAKQYGSVVGGIKVEDRNKNGKIDPDDRKILGSDVPKLRGGITNNFSYKGFHLSVLMFGQFGNMIQSPVYGSFRFLSGRINQYNVNYWTKDNPTNDYPQPNVNQETPFYGSTLSYMDGSFVKIRNINFAYDVNPSIAQKLKMQSLRFYFDLQNGFVFSKYTNKYNGIDPEWPTNSTPPAKQYLFGINIKF